MTRHLAKTSLAAACALLLASGASAADTQPANPQTAPRTPTTTPGVTPGPATQPRADGELPRADRSFLEDAAHAGHTEIEGSKLAEQKAASPDVKAFARKMIQDHTKVAEELNALAARKGFKLPDGPSLTQKTELTALRALSGDTFDKMYASRVGVAAHENSVELFRQASREADDPEVRAFAAKHLPTLEHHLQEAQALHGKVDKK